MHERHGSLTAWLRLSRDELASRIVALLPDVAVGGAAPVRGGRGPALERLAALEPVAYARTRNHVDGAISGLSPWIRHGVLSLAEVRDAALARVARSEDAEKFVSELGWRDYWRRVQAAVGDRILADIEPVSRAPARPPESDLPADVAEARTGMACIDDFVRRLQGSGWLHNHERMWLASWLVHARGVSWRTGADWFLRHLLDGDPASNHLSWQWVAGTFSAKPYIFNRENLELFTAGTHCRRCDLLGRCDVEGDYDELSARWFAAGVGPPSRPPLRIRPGPASCAERPRPPSRPLCWLTIDSAAATSPALAAWPDAPRVFILDPEWLAAERPSLKRLLFLCECLADVSDVLVEVGPPATTLVGLAAKLGCDGIAVAETPCPRVGRVRGAVAATLPVDVVPWPSFCDPGRITDLGRFSRYWNAVRSTALRPTPSPTTGGSRR